MPKSMEELFHDAVYHGKMADVKKYLAKGVAVDWTDSMGWMALTIDGRTPRDLCIKWAMKKLMYSRPEYEVEYERWLYPEKYEEEQRLQEEADKAKWEEIKARM